jgi:phage terminase large subunit GpA-like protein
VATDVEAAYLSAIVESSNEAIIAKSPTGIVTSWNTYLCADRDKFQFLSEDDIRRGAAGSQQLEKIPQEVMILTAFCDVQADRLEITHGGWTKTPGECFVLSHQVIFGPTSGEAVWRDLSDLLLQRFPHPLGGRATPT